MKGRSPTAYALALRGKGATMKHRNTPRGGRNNDLDNILEAAHEERLLEEAEAALQEAMDRYGFKKDFDGVPKVR